MGKCYGPYKFFGYIEHLLNNLKHSNAQWGLVTSDARYFVVDLLMGP